MYMLKNMSYSVYEYVSKKWNDWFVTADFTVSEVSKPDDNV